MEIRAEGESIVEPNKGQRVRMYVEPMRTQTFIAVYCEDGTYIHFSMNTKDWDAFLTAATVTTANVR